MNRNADKISTLVDDELNAWEMSSAIQSLRHDPEMQKCWRNYHLIGDAIRGTLPKHIPMDLTDRISAALDHEPVFLHPQTITTPVNTGTHHRSRATVGFALAASLTAIAVIGVIGFEQDSGFQNPSSAIIAGSGGTPAQISVPAPLTSLLAATEDDVEAAPAAAQRPRIQTVSGGARAFPDGPDLYEYLMNYQQYAVHDGRDDPLSYLRVVSHGSSQ